MHNNLKKRMYTSLGLILMLTLMFFNTFILAYFLIIIGVFSILEFQHKQKNIKDKIQKYLINIFFCTYFFCVIFSSLFFLILRY